MYVNRATRIILLIVFCFLYIYNPAFSTVSTTHFLTVLSFVYMCANRSKARRLINNVSHTILLLSVILFYKAIIGLASNVPLLGAIYDPFIMIFELLINSLTLVMILDDCNISLEKVIVGAVVVQDLIAILAILMPEVKTAIISIMLRSGYSDIISAMQRHRMFGFSYTMPFGLPVIQSTIAVMFLFNSLKKKQTMKNIILFLLTGLSAILNARLSLGIIGIGIIIVVIYALFSKKVFNPKIAIFVGVTMFVITVGFSYLSEIMPTTFAWIQEGVEDILNALTNQQYGRTSYMAYATNMDNYRLPEGALRIIFGTGHITRGDSIYNSDVGYINDIWFGGIIYVIMILSLGHAFLKRLIKALKLKYDKQENFYRVLFLIITLLLANVKGRVFYANEIMNLVFLLYSWSSLTLYKQKNRLV